MTTKSLSNVEAVLREANRYLGVTEHPRNSNRGTEVDYWIRECGLDPVGGYPWCAAFVGAIGRQSCGSSWPCPRTASVAALAAWASTANLIERVPAPGDIFLLWEDSLRRFGHTGFVSGGDSRSMGTIEGNTNPGGSRDGFGVFARKRIVVPSTRFIRWERAIE